MATYRRTQRHQLRRIPVERYQSTEKRATGAAMAFAIGFIIAVLLCALFVKGV